MIETKKGTKNNRTVHSREIYLSYCIKILYDDNYNVHAILLLCIPNGYLSYSLEKGIVFSKENSILSPISPINEKDLFFNQTDVLFRYNDFCKFKLDESVNKLNTELYRIKLLYFNESLDKNVYRNPIILEEYRKI